MMPDEAARFLRGLAPVRDLEHYCKVCGTARERCFVAVGRAFCARAGDPFLRDVASAHIATGAISIGPFLVVNERGP